MVFATNAHKHGVDIVGDLKKGLNPLSINHFVFEGRYLQTVLKAGLITAILTLTEGIAIGRTFALFKNYHIDGNKEMIAIGMMNIVGSCTSCYITTGAFSRSAVNYNAGCKSAVSNIVMATAIMIVLLFLTPLFHYTPLVALSSIIVSAMLGLIDVHAFYHFWKVDKLDFLVSLAAYLGVVFVDVQIGLVIAVAISMVRVILHVTRPHTAVLGNIPNTTAYRSIEQYTDATRIPGILIRRIEAPIYFMNSSYLRERIIRWIEDEGERLAKVDEDRSRQQLGGVIGGFIPFILNYHSTAASVTDGIYIAFMCFMAFGAFLTLALLPPSKVVRDNGSKVTLIKYSNVNTEAMEILKLFSNWKMLLLFPASWSSNFFYTYQFNNVNGKIFTVRTRGFNNVFYWGAQMIRSVAIGYVLDFSFQNRKKRRFLGVAIVAILGTAIWGGGLANQLRYSRDKPLEEIDFKDSGSAFAGPFVLYFSYGLLDAMFQTICYWTIGALADDSQTLSRYSGFNKGVQSAGAVVAWQIDKHNVSLLGELIINWALTTISYPLLIIVIALAVNDGNAADSNAATVVGLV